MRGRIIAAPEAALLNRAALHKRGARAVVAAVPTSALRIQPLASPNFSVCASVQGGGSVQTAAVVGDREALARAAGFCWIFEMPWEATPQVKPLAFPVPSLFDTTTFTHRCANAVHPLACSHWIGIDRPARCRFACPTRRRGADAIGSRSARSEVLAGWTGIDCEWNARGAGFATGRRLGACELRHRLAFLSRPAATSFPTAGRGRVPVDRAEDPAAGSVGIKVAFLAPVSILASRLARLQGKA